MGSRHDRWGVPGRGDLRRPQCEHRRRTGEPGDRRRRPGRHSRSEHGSASSARHRPRPPGPRPRMRSRRSTRRSLRGPTSGIASSLHTTRSRARSATSCFSATTARSPQTRCSPLLANAVPTLADDQIALLGSLPVDNWTQIADAGRAGPGGDPLGGGARRHAGRGPPAGAHQHHQRPLAAAARAGRRPCRRPGGTQLAAVRLEDGERARRGPQRGRRHRGRGAPGRDRGACR